MVFQQFKITASGKVIQEVPNSFQRRGMSMAHQVWYPFNSGKGLRAILLYILTYKLYLPVESLIMLRSLFVLRRFFGSTYHFIQLNSMPKVTNGLKCSLIKRLQESEFQIMPNHNLEKLFISNSLPPEKASKLVRLLLLSRA